MLTADGQSRLEKLAPFARRARCFENGREKLYQHRKKLAFILVTEDVAENSRDEVLRTFACPVYQALTAAEIMRHFGMDNTKILGFRKSTMSTQLETCFDGCRLNAEAAAATADPQPPAP